MSVFTGTPIGEGGHYECRRYVAIEFWYLKDSVIGGERQIAHSGQRAARPIACPRTTANTGTRLCFNAS